MHRLGNGEFESISDGRITPSIHDARDYFCMAIRELTPEVLDDLANESLAHYRNTKLHFDENDYQERLKGLNEYDRIREIMRLRMHHEWSSPSWHTHFEDGEITYDEPLAALQRNLFEWSLKWNLNQAWCRERAFRTLDFWCSSTESYNERIWQYEPLWETVIAFRRGEHPKFVFEYETLYPRVGHRSYVTKQITAAFKKKLRDFLDNREQMAREAGMRPTPTKREKQHFEWIVCFQVKKMSYQEILEQYYPKDYETAKMNGTLNEYTKRIRKAVNEVSRFIGLPLRNDGIAPGRRATKSKNRNFRPTTK